MTARSVSDLAADVRNHCIQGERAMLYLVWTMANVNWRASLDELVARLEAAEAQVAALTAAFYDYGLEASVCAYCNCVMQAVRPGKTQCRSCEAREAAEAALADTRRALEEAKWLIGAGLPHTMEWHDRADAWYTEARRALAATGGDTPTFQGVPIVVDPDMPEGTFELRKLKGGGTGQEQQP